MADTIFFTEVDAAVKKALDLRKSYYKGSTKDTNAYSWLYRKTAYLQATVISKSSGKTITLGVRTSGGLGPKGLYREQKQTPKFIPKPHLESLRISPQADWGTVVRSELVFKVYSLADLNECQPFFDLGSDIKILYGWNKAGPAGGSQGELNAVIFNFSHQLDTNGGYTCTVQAMSKGLAITAGASTTGGKTVSNSSVGDSVSISKSLNLLTSLEVFKKTEAAIPVNTINTRIGLGVAQLPENLLKSTSESGEEKEKDPTQMYVSLEKLIRQINTVLFDRDVYICNELVTKGYTKNLNSTLEKVKLEENIEISTNVISATATRDTTSPIPISVPDSDLFVSADPTKIIFPGYCKYYGIVIGFSESYASEFKAGDLSKTMINIDYLIDVYQKILDKKESNTKSKDTSISNFITQILTTIYECSGTRFSLGIYQNPKNQTELFITDSSYIGEETKSITPYEITSVTQGGIARNVSAQTDLSPEMISAAFATSLSSIGAIPTFDPNNTSPSSAEADEMNSNIDALQEDLFNSIRELAVNNSDAASTTLISNLQAALKNLYQFETRDVKSGKAKGFIYPLNLSFTLDGINGLSFGNAITTNYLPAAYKKGDIGFTITAVEHSISGNNWETTINTVMRII